MVYRCAPLALALSAVSLCDSSAFATTYYVRKTGSNGNAGTSASAAYQTVTKAVSSAQPGDVVYVGAGTYTETVTTVRSGTDPAPIRFVADSDGSQTGDSGTAKITHWSTSVITVGHQYIEFNGFQISGGTNTVSFSGGGNDYLRACTIESFNEDGVAINGANVKIYGCTIKSGSDDAISITGTCAVSVTACTLQSCNTGVEVSSSSVKLTVDRCFMTGLGGRGITLQKGSLVLTNSLITSASGGVSVGSTYTNSATIWNCTTVGGSTAFQTEGGAMTVKNCIMSSYGTGLKKTGGTLTHSNNLYNGVGTAYSGTTAGSGDVTGDPKFVGSGSYNLQASSPAINAGTSGSSFTYYDMDLVYRPQGAAYDIGCYERLNPLSPASTPYANTFESAMGAEWSATNRSSTTTFTNFAGQHGNDKLTLALSTSPGTTYTIQFDWYGIDSWEGNELNQTYGPDRFNVAVNGATVFSNTLTWEWSYPSSYSKAADDIGYFGFGAGVKDAVYRKVSMNFTATSSVSYIDFYGDGLQSMDDESWGIDNLTVGGGGPKIKKWREVPNS